MTVHPGAILGPCFLVGGTICLGQNWNSVRVYGGVCVMPSSGLTPRIVPYGADQAAYLVVDRFAGLGSVYRETEIERTDLETLIDHLLTGQFNDPIRMIAFNTLEHWTDDVSEEIATEIQTRWDIEGVAVPGAYSRFRSRLQRPGAPAYASARLSWCRGAVHLASLSNCQEARNWSPFATRRSTSPSCRRQSTMPRNGRPRWRLSCSL